MQFINYFFASLVAFSGLLVGISLLKIAPEEKKALSKHFKILRYSSILLILFFSAFFYIREINNFLIVIGYAFFIIIIEWKITDLLNKAIIVYAAFGIIFWLSSANQNLFLIISSLIFINGTAIGSMLNNPKENLKTILYCTIFLILANLIYFL